MKKIISVLSLSLIVSFTSLYAEVEGYKDLKFGLTMSEAEPIHKKYCQGYASSQMTMNCNKILGNTSSISVFFDQETELLNRITLKFKFKVKKDKNKLKNALKKKFKFFAEVKESDTRIFNVYAKGQVWFWKEGDEWILKYVDPKFAEYSLKYYKIGEDGKVIEESGEDDI